MQEDNFNLPTGHAVRDNIHRTANREMPMAGARNTTPKVYKDQFLGRIKAARKALDMTQAEMAASLGIPQDKYKQYESRSLLPHHLIPKFCEVTGLHPWFVLTGRGSARSPGLSPVPTPISSRRKAAKN